MVIHIISGDTMNEYSGELGFSGHVIVMGEEMMSGNTHADIFSQEFIKVRSGFHSMNPDKYKKRIATPFLKMRQNDEVHLWFGKDMFCQMNMLTILAYLEKLGIEKAVFHEVFEDEMKEVSTKEISTKDMTDVYKSVLINHEFCAGPLEELNKAQDLYLETVSLRGPLCDFIRENKDDSVLTLTIKMIKGYAQYGMGDKQSARLIAAVRS